jgi:hypothetical protein
MCETLSRNRWVKKEVHETKNQKSRREAIHVHRDRQSEIQAHEQAPQHGE